MNLIIDIGNTRAKLAVFKNNKIVKTVVCYKEKLEATQHQLRQEFPSIKHGILANVAAPENATQKSLAALPGKKIILSANTPVPFINTYKSPDTLGIDRIALAAAAASVYPDKNVLVIDAGTCITYDLITADKHYLGGAISPGINMRFRSLNNFTANLPLLKANHDEPVKLGRNTAESIHLGVIQGLRHEVNGFIENYNQSFESLTVILTGGDCEILSKSVKNSIFAAKNFLLTGLNCILDYNKH